MGFVTLGLDGFRSCLASPNHNERPPRESECEFDWRDERKGVLKSRPLGPAKCSVSCQLASVTRS